MDSWSRRRTEVESANPKDSELDIPGHFSRVKGDVSLKTGFSKVATFVSDEENDDSRGSVLHLSNPTFSSETAAKSAPSHVTQPRKHFRVVPTIHHGHWQIARLSTDDSSSILVDRLSGSEVDISSGSYTGATIDSSVTEPKDASGKKRPSWKRCFRCSFVRGFIHKDGTLEPHSRPWCPDIQCLLCTFCPLCNCPGEKAKRPGFVPWNLNRCHHCHGRGFDVKSVVRDILVPNKLNVNDYLEQRRKLYMEKKTTRDKRICLKCEGAGAIKCNADEIERWEKSKERHAKVRNVKNVNLMVRHLMKGRAGNFLLQK